MGIVKNKFLIVFVIIFLIVVMFGAICFFKTRDSIYETTKTDEYYLQVPEIKSKLKLSFFPDTIPDTVTAKYHYCKYYSAYDIYLELSFRNVEELLQFVDLQTQDDDVLVNRTNPYNGNYIEYFSKSVGASSYQNDIEQTVNYIDYYNESHIGTCFFSMNVSEADLKVVITYFAGKFETKQYIPTYLHYFNVSLDENLHDYVELSNNG